MSGEQYVGRHRLFGDGFALSFDTLADYRAFCRARNRIEARKLWLALRVSKNFT